MLVASLSLAAQAQAAPAAIILQVDASARHSISPYIYGMNFADASLAAELRLPVNRWGGNSTTRYNWQLDTSNRASDWYFENIANDNDNIAALPNGSASDQFVDQNRGTGTESILTLPLIGWTPKDRGQGCGFGVSKYGAQQYTDYWRPDCGNGVRANGTEITGNDPTDTSKAIGLDFVQGWIAHLNARYGTAAGGGVRFYDLDNEPMLWNSTHRDVHPTPTSYDELRDRTFQYAAAVKASDPSTQTLGPVLWGWTAYFWSALDTAEGGDWWNHPQDRLAHRDTPFVAWYLQQMKLYEQQHGVRILDYLDLHYYPQQSGVALNEAGNTATQTLRLRSTRALWDPTYADESWIDTPVTLIPRMKAWVDANYPGTKLAITEYNWGGLESINGALAQADVLGIFGREGLDLATLWSPPKPDQPGAFAFRMYRNYDGAGGQFGSTGVSAASSDQSKLAVYASLRPADGALTVMVINKTNSQVNVPLALSGFSPSCVAKVYQYSADNLKEIQRRVNREVTESGFRMSYMANSITLVVIPGPGVPCQDRVDYLYLPLSVR
jgi:hypothetical protein